MGCSCKETTGGSYEDDCPFLIASYILAGLSMMLNIRLAYSSAPYALIRFRLPENLFSVFVRRMASALEFWCLPSMLLGNIIEIAQRVSAESKDSFKLDHTKKQDSGQNNNLGTLILMKQKKFHFIIIPSMLTMWSDFITYLILLIVYVTGGDQGNVTAYYFVIAISGFIFGINMVFVYAADWRYTPVYIAGENAFPMLTSIIHYFTTLIFGNRRKWNSDFLIVNIDIIVAIIISLTTASLWTYSYEILKHGEGNEANKFKFNVLPGPFGFTDPYSTESNPANDDNAVNLTGSAGFQSKAAITVKTASGSNLPTLTGQVDINITEGTIKNKYGTPLQTETQLKQNTVLELKANGTLNAASVNVTGIIVVTNEGNLGTPLSITGGPRSGNVSGSLNLATDSGNRHITITSGTGSNSLTIPNDTYNRLKTNGTLKIGNTDAPSAARNPENATGDAANAGLNNEPSFTKYWHLLPSDRYDEGDLPDPAVASPALMVIIGMGFVYCIYPGIAPGMIVPFYLIDKIETVLLVLTTFPPVIIAILQKHAKEWSPKTINKDGKFQGWKKYQDYGGGDVYGQIWHFFDILMIIKMTLLVIFIYCLHYRDSHISRSIVNQPKMSTFLTIVFYMCHECLLALGFSGVIGNNGATYVVLPAQYVGALLMIFLAFYSEGYIIEYKSHDPAHCPTDGMWYLYGYYQLNPDFLI